MKFRFRLPCRAVAPREGGSLFPLRPPVQSNRKSQIKNPDTFGHHWTPLDTIGHKKNFGADTRATGQAAARKSDQNSDPFWDPLNYQALAQQIPLSFLTPIASPNFVCHLCRHRWRLC